MSALLGIVVGATKVWWYVSRSSGFVAWGLAVAAVLWGLALSTRALGRRPPAPWLNDLHRFLGGLTVVFVGIHLVGLVLDPWVSFGAIDLLVPGAASWSPVAVAWGVVAFYCLLAVEITSLLRRRLPTRLWRGVHLASYAMYVMATVHLLTAGTDRHNPILRGAVAISMGAIAFFTVYRLIGPGRAASVKGPVRPSPVGRSAIGPVVGPPGAAEWPAHVQAGDRPIRRGGRDASGVGPGS